jgi:hypothetical protein
MSGGRDDAHSHIASAAAIRVQHADEINSLPLAADNGQLQSGWRTRRSWRRSGLGYGAAANGCQDCYQREPRIAHPCPPVLRNLSADGVDHQRWADPFEAFLDRGVGDDLIVSGNGRLGSIDSGGPVMTARTAGIGADPPLLERSTNAKDCPKADPPL